MEKYKNMTFRVNNYHESKMLQSYLFSLGYEWTSGKQDYFNICDCYIFTYKENRTLNFGLDTDLDSDHIITRLAIFESPLWKAIYGEIT